MPPLRRRELPLLLGPPTQLVQLSILERQQLAFIIPKPMLLKLGQQEVVRLGFVRIEW